MTSPHAIRIEHATKCYGRTRAVDDVSFEVRAGEVFAFLGPNGAGKTTTIKMITGLLRPDLGRVQVCGVDVAEDPQAAKALLAYVPDQPFLYDKLTSREFLRFVGQMYGLDEAAIQQRGEAYMRRLGITNFADRLTEDYSHGMKQKVVLAAALLHDPQVLVVDEPMVGLDPRSIRIVKDIFRERADAGRTVFMSTHTLDMAETLGDRICIIHHGRIVAYGTLAELKAQARREQRLEDIFLELTNPEPLALPEDGDGAIAAPSAAASPLLQSDALTNGPSA